MNWATWAVATALLSTAATAQAALIYSNNFESGSTAQLSGFTTIARSPTGKRFIGLMNGFRTTSLTLDVRGYDALTVSFDLYGIGDLDARGNPGLLSDQFGVFVYADGVFHSTQFAVELSNDPADLMLYNRNLVPGRTFSNPALDNQLGYALAFGDATYQSSFNFQLQGYTNVRLDFVAFTDQGADNEALGLDNILVNAAGNGPPVILPPTGGVPEPASWALLITGFGLTGVAMRRRCTNIVAA